MYMYVHCTYCTVCVLYSICLQIFNIHSRVLLGSTKSDHQSLLSELRAASVAKTPLSKVLDARKLTEQYRCVVDSLQ